MTKKPRSVEIKMEGEDENESNLPPSIQVYKKSKTIMVKVIQLEIDNKGKENMRMIYMDGTGHFPKQLQT